VRNSLCSQPDTPALLIHIDNWLGTGIRHSLVDFPVNKRACPQCHCLEAELNRDACPAKIIVPLVDVRITCNRTANAQTTAMSDPLSIIASAIGLVATSAKIATTAKQLYDSGKDAPASIRRIGEEMDQLHLIFGQVQTLLEGHARKRPSRSRLTMLPLHHLMTILSGCVLAYSSLDKKLTELGRVGFGARVKWALWKEAEAGVILLELERHKASLHMMLTIIQW